MSHIEKATFDERDFTEIVNSDRLPHSWVCPHCGKFYKTTLKRLLKR